MQAEKLILETDENGDLIAVPKLPAKARFEAIFLVLEPPLEPRRRRPPPELGGSVTWTGDPLAPAVSGSDWDASFERTEHQIAGDPEKFK